MVRFRTSFSAARRSDLNLRAISLAAALLAAGVGCTPLPLAQWRRPGTDAATAQRDLQACRQTALTQRPHQGLGNDRYFGEPGEAMLPTFPGDWNSYLYGDSPGGFSAAPTPTQIGNDGQLARREIESSCMQSKGYVMVPTAGR